MCFVKRQKSKPKVRIAKKNIVCYKTVKTDMSPFHFNDQPKYILGKAYYALDWADNRIKSLDTRDNDCGSWNVYEGIHSYKTKGGAVFLLKRWGGLMLECLIPKGTPYLSNDEEYVSTKIKPIKILEV